MKGPPQVQSRGFWVPESLLPAHYWEKWHSLCWGLDSVSLVAFAPKALRKRCQSGLGLGKRLVVSLKAERLTREPLMLVLGVYHLLISSFWI